MLRLIAMKTLYMGVFCKTCVETAPALAAALTAQSRNCIAARVTQQHVLWDRGTTFPAPMPRQFHFHGFSCSPTSLRDTIRTRSHTHAGAYARVSHASICGRRWGRKEHGRLPARLLLHTKGGGLPAERLSAGRGPAYLDSTNISTAAPADFAAAACACTWPDRRVATH